MKNLRALVAMALAMLCAVFAGAAAAQASQASASGPPRIDGFDVEQVASLAPGTPLLFTLFGSAGGEASLRIAGAQRALVLREHEPGVYEGVYILHAGDQVQPGSRVIADLNSDGGHVSSVLEEPLVLGTPVALPDDPPSATPPAPVWAQAPMLSPRAEVSPAVPACGSCGVVESIDRWRSPHARNVLATLAGGLVGAFLGDQLTDSERHRRVARVLGAVGGAWVGHEIERSAQSGTRYDVVVRLQSGERRHVAMSEAPPWRVGDGVEIVDGRLRRLAR